MLHTGRRASIARIGCQLCCLHAYVELGYSRLELLNNNNAFFFGLIALGAIVGAATECWQIAVVEQRKTHDTHQRLYH